MISVTRLGALHSRRSDDGAITIDGRFILRDRGCTGGSYQATCIGRLICPAVLAVIAGAEGWEDIEEFGHDKHRWLKSICDYLTGILSKSGHELFYVFSSNATRFPARQQAAPVPRTASSPRTLCSTMLATTAPQQ